MEYHANEHRGESQTAEDRLEDGRGSKGGMGKGFEWTWRVRPFAGELCLSRDWDNPGSRSKAKKTKELRGTRIIKTEREGVRSHLAPPAPILL